MRKYKLAELREMCRTGMATDITNYSHDEINEFVKAHSYDKVGYSASVYGLNGCLLQDCKTGEFYAVHARNSNLLIVF